MPDNAIKIVIWDLDDTFWPGVLAEGSARFDPEKAALVATLNERGVVNAICSKNDHATVETYLTENCAWDHFVFSSISWGEKSAGIQHILDTLGLRPQNAVFIDDNFHNRAEVAHAIPELDVRDVDFIPELLTTPRITPGKSRVAQYRIVAKRARSMKAATSNIEFLRASHIQVSITSVDDLDRAVEMVERTNQLNFTKRRDVKGTINALINDPNYECAFVRCRDDWGDYGVVGFYAYRPSRKELRHFLFSCRILGLGVEKFIYNRLGRPPFTISGEVVENLDETDIDWIEVIDQSAAAAVPIVAPANLAKRRIILRGGCDLEPVAELLRSRGLRVEKDVGNLCNQTQIGYLLDAKNLSEADKQRYIEQAPFIVADTYRSKLLDGPVDAAVLSLLIDYSRDFYLDPQTGARLYAETSSGLSNNPVAGQDDNLFYLKRDYRKSPIIGPEEFRELLERFDIQFPDIPRIVFVNGAEIEGVRLADKHAALNKVLDEFVAARPGGRFRIVDVRAFVKERSDLRESNIIRHYVRAAYVAIAQELVAALA